MSNPPSADKFALLYEVGRLVNSTLDLDRVLELVMDTVIEVTRAERGFLNLLDESSGELTFRVARSFDRETIESAGFEVSRSLLRQVATTGKPVLTADAASDTRLGQFSSVALYGLRSVLCAPLQARGQTLGAVYVDNRFQRGVFTPEDLDLLMAFANQAALAIDNARLFSRLQDAKLYQDSIFASVPTAILTLDPQGRVQAFNAAAARLFGRTSSEALGSLYTDLLPAGLGGKLLRPILSVAAANAPHPSTTLEIVSDLPSSAGAVLHVRITLLRDHQGRSLGVVLAFDDLTEQRRAEEARRQAEEAHTRVRQVFGQFLPPKLVDRFVADPSRLRLPGERQEVSIIFADLRGYTTLAERLSPEEVVSLLNQYLTLAAREIQASSGYLDKFIGDAVMGVYNALEPVPDHAQVAVATAVRIQEQLAALAERLNLPELRAGIGVNTGPAVVGTVGPENAVNFTVMGDAVNVAARLQSAARGGEILLSADTYHRVQDAVRVEPLEPLSVKGRVQPVLTYRISASRC